MVVVGGSAFAAAPDVAKCLHFVDALYAWRDVPIERHAAGLVHAAVHDDFRTGRVLSDRHLHLPRGVSQPLAERFFPVLAV